MGSALAKALLASSFCSKSALHIAERNSETRLLLSNELGCTVAESFSDLEASREAMVFLAVKPLDGRGACHGLEDFLKNMPVFVSIMAGCSIARLREYLGGYPRIVRAMPNLPVQVGCGVTAFSCAPELEPSDKARVLKAFQTCGAAFEVASEEMVDAATAISGSGPAYLYYFVEYVQQSAEALGFTTIEARQMVLATFEGALELMKQSGRTANDLRSAVTSPKGTTAAAIAVFESKQIGAIIAEALSAAFKRARELGS